MIAQGGRGSGRPAVFLDRDGTIIESVPYLNDSARVVLVDGCGDALRILRDLGFALVVVSNQSGLGRGSILPEEHGAVTDRLVALLHVEGVELAGIYTCPAVPVSGDRTLVEHPDRKPGPGMLVRAALDVDLDLEASWMVGDMISDVLAGRNAGCRGSVLLGGSPNSEANEVIGSDGAMHRCETLLDASRSIRDVTLAGRVRHGSDVPRRPMIVP